MSLRPASLTALVSCALLSLPPPAASAADPPGPSQPPAVGAAPQPSSTAPPQRQSGRLHLLFTSDIYGRFAWPGCGERPRDRADLSHLVAAVESERSALRKAGEPEPVVLSGGSMTRPDILGAHLFGAGRAWAPSAVKLLARVGFDAVAVGPYDFGASPSALRRYMKLMRGAGIPLLAGNVFCNDAQDWRCQHLGQGGRRYVVLERGGLKIGIFSVTREDLPQRILKRSRGSLSTEDPVKEARKLVHLLRQQEGVHLVVALATLNLESNAPQPVVDFVRSLGADAPELVVADAMFDRNSADFIARVQSKLGSAIVGTDRFGQHLGYATINYRRQGERVTVPRIDVEVRPLASVKPDKYAALHVRDMLGELCRSMNRPLGSAHLSAPLEHDALVAYIMQIMRNHEGAEVALLNDSAVADVSLPRGPVTREMILRAVRTETALGSAWITGARLKALLTPFIAGRREGLNQLGVKLEGGTWYVNNRPLQDGLHYRVAMTRFLSQGGDGLIALGTERFRGSGFSLRRVVIDHFREGRQARHDDNDDVSLVTDFPDPWEKWVLFGGAEAGLSVSNISIDNGDAGDRYSKPLLKRDNLTSLQVNVKLSLGASNRTHAFEGDVSLQYGKSWTLTAAEKAAGNDATEAEVLDRIQTDLLYRLNALRSLQGPGRWYVPAPYAEATIISEFTRSGACATGSPCEQAGASKSFRYLDIGGTMGAGFLLHPSLFVKTGFAVSGEVLTPDDAYAPGDVKDARMGLYLGYKLRRMTLIATPRHPLQAESRLDFFMTDLGGSIRRELTLQSKVYFSLIPLIHLTATHQLYFFKTRDRNAGVANDISLGLQFLLDYRHQVL